MVAFGKITNYSGVPKMADHIASPPEILQSPLDDYPVSLLYVVGRRTLLLHNTECTLGPHNTILFNALQALTAARGREASFSFSDMQTSIPDSGYSMQNNALIRTIRLLEEFSKDAKIDNLHSITERVPRQRKPGQKELCYGSGSGVQYRFYPGLQIADLRSPEYLALINKNTTQ